MLLAAESGSGFQRIIDADGFGIALTGILIVFCALSLITLCLAAMPQMLDVLAKVLPEVEHHASSPAAARAAAGLAGVSQDDVRPSGVPGTPDLRAVAAAAAAFHERRQAE